MFLFLHCLTSGLWSITEPSPDAPATKGMSCEPMSCAWLARRAVQKHAPCAGAPGTNKLSRPEGT